MNNNEPNARKEGPRVPDAAPRHRHLTPQMRAALNAARSQPLRRVHKPGPGRPPWPAHASTLAALVRHELMVRSERASRNGNRVVEWSITDAGLAALDPPPRPPRSAPPRLLAERPGRAQRFCTLPSGRQVAVGQGADLPSFVDERDPSGDYTSSSFRAATAEPECVDEQTLLDIADDGRHRFAQRRAQVRRDVVAERFERARRAAEAQGRDVRSAVRLVERAAQTLERGEQGAA